jgi:hypothetical protein
MELIKADTLSDIKTMAAQYLERIVPSEEVIAIRDEMLATVKVACKQCTTAQEQQTVATYAKELKNWLKQAEDYQETINAIILPIQRKSRQMTNDVCAPAEKLLENLKTMLTAFSVAEERRVRAENEERQRKIREAQAEADRLAREAEKKQREIEAANIEARRLQEEAMRMVLEAKTAKDKQAARVAAKIAQQAALAVGQAEAEAAAQAEIAAYRAAEQERAATLVQVVEASKQKGLVGGKKKVWSLQDDPEAIHRLYAHNRALVRMEPNASAIQAICMPEMPTPGIDMRWERKTDIRGS